MYFDYNFTEHGFQGPIHEPVIALTSIGDKPSSEPMMRFNDS